MYGMVVDVLYILYINISMMIQFIPTQRTKMIAGVMRVYSEDVMVTDIDSWYNA